MNLGSTGVVCRGIIVVASSLFVDLCVMTVRRDQLSDPVPSPFYHGGNAYRYALWIVLRLRFFLDSRNKRHLA